MEAPSSFTSLLMDTALKLEPLSACSSAYILDLGKSRTVYLRHRERVSAAAKPRVCENESGEEAV